MVAIYTNFIYQPILNALVFVYNHLAFKDLGLAIIIVTLLVRIVLYPLFQKSARHQAVMQRLQPKIKKIQEEHKGKHEAQSAALMQLFKEHEINPFSGFLLLLVQLPILFALYHIFLDILKPETFQYLYSFIERPNEISTSFLGLIDLSKSAILDKQNSIIVVLAAIAQYFQGRLSLANTSKGANLSPAEQMSKRMLVLMPFITLMIFYNLPAAISLYWLAATVFSVIQQILINKKLNNGDLGKLSEGTS